MRPVFSGGQYIKEVKLIGGSKTDTDNLKEQYQNQGWTVIDYDLNKGCGSKSDYIFLLYKAETCTSGYNNGYISDFVICNDENYPGDFTYHDHFYCLVPCDGSDDFKNSDGDLNNKAGGEYIHLYYTREPFSDHRAVYSISFDNTLDKAVTLRDNDPGYTNKDEGYNLNDGTSGEQIYMHIKTGKCDY